ncbi:2-(3-amino-3-carboxypropyl)histidine synthase subunit 1 [Chlorella vulgaris]
MQADPEPQRFSGKAAAVNQEGPLSTALVPAAAAAAAAPRVVRRVLGQQVPPDILENAALNAAIAILPANYSFEVHKTIWRIRQAGAKRVALQFPEGLLLYACVIADILEGFGGVEQTFILGDVTFGACCVDDYSAAALGADFLVHYGHSCLVPVDVTSLPCQYVFVDIKMDTQHLVDTVRLNFPAGSKLVLAGTIQFASCMQAARQQLAADYPHIAIPQSRPLSPGEVLGCTAPKIAGDCDAIVFVADGRFHLEALMIANPTVSAYRYDPYPRQLTRERYDHAGMQAARRAAIEAAAGARCWGLVLGTLGRQGNPRILAQLQDLLQAQGRQCVTVLLSEVSPAKLEALSHGIDAWVQIACPRLSIDWGEGFKLPTLNPYEAFVALGEVPGWWDAGTAYPMDYYAADGGAWSSTYHRKKPRAPGASPLAAARAARVAAGAAAASRRSGSPAGVDAPEPTM